MTLATRREREIFWSANADRVRSPESNLNGSRWRRVREQSPRRLLEPAALSRSERTRRTRIRAIPQDTMGVYVYFTIPSVQLHNVRRTCAPPTCTVTVDSADGTYPFTTGCRSPTSIGRRFWKAAERTRKARVPSKRIRLASAESTTTPTELPQHGQTSRPSASASRWPRRGSIRMRIDGRCAISVIRFPTGYRSQTSAPSLTGAASEARGLSPSRQPLALRIRARAI